jgi:hypothetical protein
MSKVAEHSTTTRASDVAGRFVTECSDDRCEWNGGTHPHPEPESDTHVRAAVDAPPDPAAENLLETRDRARVVKYMLDRIGAELERLETIAHLGAEDVNALSMAKGFVERAELALSRGLGL